MILNFAHRGSLTEAPENTLPAMEMAIKHKAKAVELDVQLTKDNHLIVIHDQNLSAYTNQAKGLIKDYTLDAIKKIDIGSTFSTEYKGVTFATLDEILELIPQGVIINIEIKNSPTAYSGIEQLLVSCLQQHNRLENVLISSFDYSALEKVQKAAPNLKLGLLINRRIRKAWRFIRSSGLSISSIHPNARYTNRKLIEESHRLGYKVYPYTVNSLESYNHLLKLGVDGVFSNNPAIFSQHLAEIC
ncbi:glycerophosphodiester phosphodiesterase [Virgibacillus sp. DJP39]|uniref:glycerophosphodiester phosphodiesterase n=1 Tax=Virgibacillus sp. DJP39 TaxID=3409790 RepID=UPI003BB4C6F4